LILSFSLILSCSVLKKKEQNQKQNEEKVVVKQKKFTPNMKDRILERDSGGIFNSSRKALGGTSYEFATSNVMWRATLESLDFIPLTSVNYSGGIIVTDWYTGKSNSNESIKIEVRFLDNELKATSLKVKSFKKICQNNKCSVSKNSEIFSQKIKDRIIQTARDLKIKDELKKKK